MSSLNLKLSEVQLLRLRATFYALPLFYLRKVYAAARKNYATLEIHPKVIRREALYVWDAFFLDLII